MVSTERRKPLNAKLRAKLDHIQQLVRQLQSSIEHIQAETVARARQGELTDLPCQKFANHLSPTFLEQLSAIDQIQREIKGPSVVIPLITDEERDALMN